MDLMYDALDMILIHDLDGNINYSNRACNEELGFDNGLTGVKLLEIVPEGIDNYDGSVRKLTVYRQNKTCFSASIKPIKKENQFILYIRNDSYIISLEKNIEKIKAEADDAAKVKNEFVANVTHELRTPVNGILGNTHILLDIENDAEKIHKLRTIETGCRAMNSLIDNILDFSKLEAGKFTLESREFEFRKMIDYIKSTHQPKITEKGLQFFVTISPEVPEHIIGDELRIGQILNNLLSNACKFTHVGKISLEVLKTGQKGNRVELFFMVIDTGIGIKRDDLDKLFKSFSQVDASVSRRYGGTGLGLNISRQLVELMGGNITVDSEINRGTMFSFSIWVDISEEDAKEASGHIDSYVARSFNDTLKADVSNSNMLEYGTTENIDELKKQLSKIVLCIEMENWEKAESFTESIRQLTLDAPKEVKTSILRLKMAVQKCDYDKSITAYNSVIEILQ